MEYGSGVLRRWHRAVPLGVRFFLAAALTACQTPGGYAPFALGCTAAAGGGLYAVAALAGCGVGALVFLPFSRALAYLAVAVLIATASTSFRGTALEKRSWMMPLVSVVLFAAVEGIYVAQSAQPLKNITACTAAAAITALSAHLLRPLLGSGERIEPESVLFVAAALALAIQDLHVLGISLGRALLCMLPVIAAYERGAAAGAASGLCLGLMTDLCTGSGSGIFAAGLGFAGLSAGSRSFGSRWETAGVYWAAAALSLLPVRQPMAAPLLAEAALGAVVFLLLPQKLFGGKRLRRAAAVAQSGSIRARLNQTAAALREIYECIGRSAAPVGEENPAVIFDRSAERVCRSCALRQLCWGKEYTTTFNAFNDATPYLLERGRLLAKDLPSHFSSRCIHLPELLAAVDQETSAFLLRRQYRRNMEENRRSAQGQYARLSELLSATAAGLEYSGAGKEAAAWEIGAVLRPKKNERVCGDTLDAFVTADGTQFLLLADGMGSGEGAQRESALVCRLLRQFLEAGVEPSAALKTLNDAMALRGAETGSFTTVDLLCCRSSGEGTIYKYGAAPSYVKKGGSVRRISGGSLPAGVKMEPSAPDITHITLAPGSFAVMASDGLTDPAQDEWLMDFLAGWDGDDPQTLANLLMKECAAREDGRDDCAIQVLYLPPENVKAV